MSKYLDEFRDPDIARLMLEEIRGLVTRPWVIMEICGGQTHAIVRTCAMACSRAISC